MLNKLKKIRKWSVSSKQISWSVIVDTVGFSIMCVIIIPVFDWKATNQPIVIIMICLNVLLVILIMLLVVTYQAYALFVTHTSFKLDFNCVWWTLPKQVESWNPPRVIKPNYKMAVCFSVAPNWIKQCVLKILRKDSNWSGAILTTIALMTYERRWYLKYF